MSGHSKFANIKHKKEKKNQKERIRNVRTFKIRKHKT